MGTRFDGKLALVALACGMMLAWLSVARYEGYNAGMYDLGIMAQSIWTGTQGDPLDHTAPGIGPHSRMNIHVEFAYYLFVPLYALWPDPRLLLMVQAALFILGAIPVYRMGLRRTGSVFAARAFAVIYLFYPTAQTSVLFDFHGDTLAMPMLLFALDALDARAWRSYALFLALSLSCKFYVALPVAGIGAYLLLWGDPPAEQGRFALTPIRTVGIATGVIAVLYGAFAFFIVRPMFAPPPGILSESSDWYLAHYFGDPSVILTTIPDRLIHAVIVFAPVLLVAWRGWRWLLPGLPVALVMLLSPSPGGGYDFRYHHYAVVVPFILMAAIDGTDRAKRWHEQRTTSTDAGKGARPARRGGRSWRGDLTLTLIIVLLFSIPLVDTPLNPLFWLRIPGQGLDPSVYGVTERDHMKDHVLDNLVPPDARLATSTLLSPHLVNRETLYLVRYADDPGAEGIPSVLPLVDYVLADALFDFYMPLGEGSYGGGVAYEHEAIGVVMRDPAFDLVSQRDGLVLFQRDAAPDAVLMQQVDVLPGEAPAPLTRFGDEIGLVQATFTPLGDRRFRATFDWVATTAPTTPAMPAIAVSRLEGVELARVVHLPTSALLTTDQWPPGQVVRETFDVQFSHALPPGEYNWWVGWYRINHPYSYATDARSRVPGSQEMVVGTITLAP